MPETKERPRLTRNPDDCMGEIVSEMHLENAVDRGNVEEGRLEESEIRTVEIEGVVDTGARAGLALPQDVVDRLGVRTQRQVDAQLADGRRTALPVVGPINVTIEGRTTVTEAFALPEGRDALIGQIVLEGLDLLADCTRERLTVPPDSPERPTFRL
ncbi:MAG: clan AA aspartic protease [Bacteroidetes bacterium QS_8_68_15]|nr:MAG: clan AA aspartic protease [Bacteroidetes bacterium QS_8_68_15]